jgi:hypothetical protein
LPPIWIEPVPIVVPGGSGFDAPRSDRRPTGPSTVVGPRTTGPAATLTSTVRRDRARDRAHHRHALDHGRARLDLRGRCGGAERVHLQRVGLDCRPRLGDHARIHDLGRDRLDSGRERKVAVLRERLWRGRELFGRRRRQLGLFLEQLHRDHVLLDHGREAREQHEQREPDPWSIAEPVRKVRVRAESSLSE